MVKGRAALRITPYLDETERDSTAQLRERLRMVIGGDSCRDVGDRTSTHPETVRRYLATGTPSFDFVQKVCESYAISAEWMLHGRGRAFRRDRLDVNLCTATIPQLLQALGERLGAVGHAHHKPGSRESLLARQVELKNHESRDSKRDHAASVHQFLESRST